MRQYVLAGHQFIYPWLLGMVFDVWLGTLEFVIGEATPPNDYQHPLHFRLIYRDVSEAQIYRRSLPPNVRLAASRSAEDEPFQREEITLCGESPTPGSVVIEDDGVRVLTDVPYRRSDTALVRPMVPDSVPKQVWLTTWTSHIQAVYFGESRLLPMTEEEARREWELQRERDAR